MREIKFRAWFKDKKVFRYFDLNSVTAWPAGKIYEPYQQYTGLKDKNGKEIYEGDIVSYLEEYQEVAWSDKLARPMLKPYTIERHYDLNYVIAEDCVVIGNLHENPELLEGDK